MFWLGILIGLFIGANVGVFMVGLLLGAKKTEWCGDCSRGAVIGVFIEDKYRNFPNGSAERTFAKAALEASDG